MYFVKSLCNNRPREDGIIFSGIVRFCRGFHEENRLYIRSRGIGVCIGLCRIFYFILGFFMVLVKSKIKHF